MEQTSTGEHRRLQYAFDAYSYDPRAYLGDIDSALGFGGSAEINIDEMFATLDEPLPKDASADQKLDRDAAQHVTAPTAACASRDRKEKAGDVTEGFSLPDDLEAKREKVAAWSDADLVATLERLSNSTHRDTGEVLRYEGDLRLWLFAINMELNERGRLAPRFRNLRRPPRQGSSVEDVNLSRDRQVIDLHWLHCRGERRTIVKKEYRRLLINPAFDLELAGRFASEKATSCTKATWLNLPDDLQWQLAAIQPKAMRDKDRDLVNGRYENRKLVRAGQPQIRTLLELALTNKPQNLKYIDEWALLWRCVQMVGADPVPLARLFALAMGSTEPLNRTTMRRKREAVEKCIARGKKLTKHLPNDDPS